MVKYHIRDAPCKSDSKYVLYDGFKNGVKQLDYRVLLEDSSIILVRKLKKLDTFYNVHILSGKRL